MSIIKTYEISTINEVQDTYSEMLRIEEKAKYKDYDSKDIMLVRTTNIFPENRTLKTLANSSFIAKSSMNFLYNALENELKYDELKK